LIFTSKNAIYSINTFNDNWKDIPSFAIAQQTAKIIKKYNANLVFTGETNHGDSFALEIKKLLKNKKVLYLRGSKVVSDLTNILHRFDILCDDIVVYESKCIKISKKISLEKDAIIIFSSPSTIKCFLKNYSWDKSYKAISIGKTTARYFPKYINPIISDDTSLKACVKKANEV
jgi:uroporphyrinogen-III synthase